MCIMSRTGVIIVLACLWAATYTTNAFVTLLQTPKYHRGRLSSLPVTSSSEEDDGLGAARSLLFSDQHVAMSDRAEVEAGLLEDLVELEISPVDVKARSRATSRSRSMGMSGGGMGMGTSKTDTKGKKNKKKKGSSGSNINTRKSVTHSSSSSDNSISTECVRLAKTVREDGVVRVNSVLSMEMASSLRAAVLDELECMRDDVRRDASLSKDYFYVPAEIHFSTTRGYILLPFRDRKSEQSGDNNKDRRIVKATKELFHPGSPLSELFADLCSTPNDGTTHSNTNTADPILYDFCALRTEPGTARQLVHSDTPYQKTPALYCAFIALQDVSIPMGGTMFFKGTHDTLKSSERRQFDVGGEITDDMLQSFSNPACVHMNAGDAVLFDMRVLHAGLPNLETLGAQRILLAVTFRNPNARGELGHRPNLRPDYVNRFTLKTFQEELIKVDPFGASGDGIVRPS